MVYKTKIKYWIKTTQDIFQFCIEKILKMAKFRRHVFMFRVVSDNKKNWYDENYSISMRDFKIFIEKIQNEGFEISSTTDFLRKDHKKKVLLTFDDAFSCIYEEAFPYLKEKNVPFSVFQCWNLMGKEKYLSYEMIAEMLKFDKFELGAHGISHSRLAEMSGGMSCEEMWNSKRNLERTFNIEVCGAAYPYGAKSDVKIRDMIYTQKAGYYFAFGTVAAGVFPFVKGGFYLPRINVNQKNYTEILDGCGR